MCGSHNSNAVQNQADLWVYYGIDTEYVVFAFAFNIK